MEIVDVVSDARSGAIPPRSACRSGSRSGCRPRCGDRTSYTPAWTHPPAAAAPPRSVSRTGRRRTLPVPEVDGSPKPMRAAPAGQQKTRPVRPECHHPDLRPRHGRAGARRPAPRSGRGAARGAGRCRRPRVRSCRTTSQTTSRAIPLTETDPPVGQDEPRSITPADPDTFTTSVSSGQFHHAPPLWCADPCKALPLSRDPLVRLLTARTTERSQAASPVARRRRRSSPTAPPWPWPAPSRGSARHRRGC